MTDHTLTWTTGDTTWTFAPIGGDDGPLGLVEITGPAVQCADSARARQPLVEVRTADDGGRHVAGSRIGGRLRLTSHEASSTDAGDQLVIVQDDPETRLRATTTCTVADGTRALRATTTVSLPPHAPASLRLWAVSSLCTGAVLSDDPADLDVWSGATTWAGEHRWSSEPLRALGVVRTDPVGRGPHHSGAIVKHAVSSMSSEGWAPAGVATHRASGLSLAWQIEHNGGWSWSVSEKPTPGVFPIIGTTQPIGRPRADHHLDGVSLVLQGPSDLRHHWNVELTPGSSFMSVPVTIAAGPTRDDALGELTRHRRATRRPHPTWTTNEALRATLPPDTMPIVFNDYMDTLEGDPTEGKLLPLIDSAAEVGCDMFCIDAGWYDDTDGWWASVGDWQPSTARFPNGLMSVLDHIRSRGMVAGLWVEPEVVGVTSAAAGDLPEDAFMGRDGVRLTENGRHFLDFRSPAAVAHLDACIDRLVGELGVGFFKFDHNCTPGPGTDRGTGGAVGNQLLEHERAFLNWLVGLQERHPHVVIESCASGAMRSDFAMLSRLSLQSTSDQQDPLLYPAIAVGALAHINPEQAGNWAYPQPSMTDEQIVFTECVGLAGRVYQAGVIDHHMAAGQRALVAEALRVHRETLPVVARSIPRFPTGLPNWDDGWVSVAFDADDQTLLIAWRQAWAQPSVTLELPHLAGAAGEVQLLYPTFGDVAEWQVQPEDGRIVLTAADSVAAARMFTISR